MRYKELINKIHIVMLDCEEEIPLQATEEQITLLQENFKKDFGYDLPEIYAKILRLTNGLNYNGLTIWPANKYGKFKETLIEAIKDFRDCFSRDYLYYAQCNGLLFVYKLKTKQYIALDMQGHVEYETFNTCDEMMTFALEIAYNEDVDDDEENEGEA